MEEQSAERSGGIAGSNEATPVAWRDLREWLALVEANGQLKRIDKPVDPDEELAAIAYLATRREDAPALMFETLTGDALRRKHPGQHAGREQGALCARGRARSVALDRRDDRGDPRHHAAADQARARAESQGAGQRDRAARQRDRSHAIPGAEILAGRRRPLYRHRQHHADAEIPTPAASMSAATGRCCTGRAASGSTARRASTG